MLRFLALLASIVAVVWVLSYFAAPALPKVDGRDITPLDAIAPAAPRLLEDPRVEERVEESTVPKVEERKEERESGEKKGKGKGEKKRGKRG